MKKVIISDTGKVITGGTGAHYVDDGQLPPEYREVLGFAFDGASWFDTGEKLLGSDLITLTLSNTASSGQNVFGCYAGTGSGTKNFSLYIYGGGSTSNSYYRYGETLYRPRYGTGTRTLTFGNADTTGGFLNNVATTPDTFTATSDAWIGMLPNSTSPAYTGAIEGRIKAGDRLEWVPCLRVADSVPGYYELHGDRFLTNQGTGAVTSLGDIE